MSPRYRFRSVLSSAGHVYRQSTFLGGSCCRLSVLSQSSFFSSSFTRFALPPDLDVGHDFAVCLRLRFSSLLLVAAFVLWLRLLRWRLRVGPTRPQFLFTFPAVGVGARAQVRRRSRRSSGRSRRDEEVLRSVAAEAEPLPDGGPSQSPRSCMPEAPMHFH
jgi:hypothetical protein